MTAAWDRPVYPGLPLSVSGGLVGTLGAIVRDQMDGSRFVLGTSHVLYAGSYGATVFQPRPCDQEGCDCNRVGVGARSRCDVVLSAGHRYFVDCAVARLDSGVGWDPAVAGQAIAGVGQARPGMRVWKVGASSGRTSGVVMDDRHQEVAKVGDGYQLVTNQLLIQALPGGERFSTAGNSGAVVLDEEARVVGLLWAASPSGYSLACPINPVLETLAVQVEPCS